jgi:HlyD family secretion protein
MAVRKKRINWFNWILLLVVLGGSVGAWAWWQAKGKAAPITLKTEIVKSGDIVQAVQANGQLSPVKNVEVGSQVSGIIREIFVDFNSRVTNGQVIAKIDPSTYDQAITRAEAELANAKAALAYAQVNHKRSKELADANLLAASEYDKTVADLLQAEASVKTREASLKSAQVDLDRTTIVAPVDGVVIQRAVDQGQTVAASFNTPKLFQIANDLRQMRIEALVSEADVGGVEEGQDVTFKVDAFQDRQFRGKVSQVRFAAITNQNVVSYTAVVDVRNDDLKLRPGMTATASIITGEKKGVLRIPNSALRYKPSEDLQPKAKGTNTVASSSKGTNAMAAQAGGAGASGGGGGSGERPNREEMRRRFESMSPEEREQMRQRMRERFGGGDGPGGGFGGGRQRQQEGPIARTIYVVDKAASTPGKPGVKPITIKTGISDSSHTEVLEGLSEGDEVVIGENNPNKIASTSAVPQGRSPFGGGGFGGGGGGGGSRGPR